MASLVKLEGAQCFRQRLVLSVLSGKPIKITKIRSEEDSPGLVDYEVTFLRLMDKLTNGSLIEIGYTGTSLLFRPGVLSIRRKIEHDCGTSRAIGYFLEPIIALAPFAKSDLNLTLTGITNDDIDPSVDILRTVSLPLLKRFGVDDSVVLKVNARGAPPLGGGEVNFQCPVVKALTPLQWGDPGMVKRIRGTVYSTRMSPQTANRVVDKARGLLNTFIPDVYIYCDHYKGAESGKSPGYAISLVAESTTGALYGADVAAEKGSLPEDIGEEAAKLLFEEILQGGCIDAQNQNMALLFMVLGPEDVSKVRLGKLSPAAIEFLRLLKTFFGVTFRIVPDTTTDTLMMTCVGIGYSNLSKRIG